MESLKIAILLLLGLIYLKVASQAARSALAHGDSFPAQVWKWPESLLSSGIVLFFLLMAIPSFTGPPGRIDLKAIESALALYASIILLLVGFLVFRNINPIDAFGLRWMSWREGLVAVIATLALVLPPIYAVQWIGYSLSGPQTEPQPIVYFLLEHQSLRDRLSVILIAVIAAPITEELVFRGCLYGFLRQTGGRFVAIATTSILFALIHGHIPSLAGLLILAVGLSLLYEKTGSLWAPILLHAAFNGLSIYATLQWPDLMK
ncbi:MAG: lysostaphin resistance A-like protein [Spartobacteria bacterium]